VNRTSLADIYAAAIEASATIHHYFNRDDGVCIEDVQRALAFLVGVIEEGPTDREAQIWTKLRSVSSVELGKLLDAHMAGSAPKMARPDDARDAARYRWLRAFSGHPLQVMDRNQECAYYESGLDAAIDRERMGDCDVPPEVECQRCHGTKWIATMFGRDNIPCPECASNVPRQEGKP
jgi:hypothetical protein